MPRETSQVDHHLYYCASQRRVESWIQKTHQELQTLSSSSTTLHRLDNNDDGQSSCGSSTLVASEELEPVHTTPLKPRRSSPSKKTKVDSQQPPRKSSQLPIKASHVRPSGQASDITSYLPYGLLPLFLAAAHSSPATVAAALILMTGYLAIDRTTEYSTSRPRRTRKSRSERK